MIAIDTNVIVRFLINDDREQAQRARVLIGRQEVFVSTSVLLETEWVLRSAYKLSHQHICETLRAFLALPKVVAQDRAAALAAFDWAEQGMEFTDALHLASAGECDAFVSFDRRLARAARKVGAMEVRTP
jgi:predicted nucleic-acid-binding protein